VLRVNNVYGLLLAVESGVGIGAIPDYMVRGNNRITQNLFISNMNCGVFVEAFAATTLVDNNIVIGTRPFTFSPDYSPTRRFSLHRKPVPLRK